MNYAIECDSKLTDEQRQALEEQFKLAQSTDKVIVLPKGMQIKRLDNEQLDRIEAKLDALISALAEDDGPVAELDLEGNLGGIERDDSEPL